MHGVLATTLANSNTNKLHVIINDKYNLPVPALLACLALDTSQVVSSYIKYKKKEKEKTFICASVLSQCV